MKEYYKDQFTVAYPMIGYFNPDQDVKDGYPKPDMTKSLFLRRMADAIYEVDNIIFRMRCVK